MTPPPLPPGVEGHPVCPDIHTGLPEPDRDGWTEPGEDAVRRALDVAIWGLRDLEDLYSQAHHAAIADSDPIGVEAYGVIVRDLSALLDKIGATR